MHLEHAVSTITFAVYIAPQVSKPEPVPDHPTHMPKLAFVSSLACYHPVYIPCLHLLPIHSIDKPFVMSILMSLSHPHVTT